MDPENKENPPPVDYNQLASDFALKYCQEIQEGREPAVADYLAQLPVAAHDKFNGLIQISTFVRAVKVGAKASQ